MPIYNGNTKVDITSKGIVKKLSSRPVYNQKFYVRCTTDNTYLKCVKHIGSTDNITYLIQPTDDIREASTCFISVDSFTGYDVLNIDTPDGTNYNCGWKSNDSTPAYTGRLTTKYNQSSVFRILLYDYDNMYFCDAFVYADAPNTPRYNSILTMVTNSQNSRYDMLVSENTVTDPSRLTYASLPIEFCELDTISTPSGIDKVYYGNTLVYQKQLKQLPYVLFSSPNNNISLNVVDNIKYWDGTLETSTDNTTWTTWDGTTTVSTTTGNLYVRGSNNTIISNSAASASKARWKLTGDNISISGNIEALLDYQTVAGGSMIANPANYTFSFIFARNSNIIDSSNLELPRTTLVSYCYSGMFNWCSNMTGIPTLPATTLATHCYDNMFTQCRSLTTPPTLPATTLATSCYNTMFGYCVSLTSIPALPALQIPLAAYNRMFEYATGIKISTTQEGDYVNEYRIPPTDTGVGLESQIALNMFVGTGGTFTGTPELNTTYYTSNTIINPE